MTGLLLEWRGVWLGRFIPLCVTNVSDDELVLPYV
jgi:hypothetical protein